VSIRIATRKSILAQVQADMIIKMLYDKHKINCEKLLVDTKGDMILDVSLDKIGGKGLFVKNIESAILEGKADAAVHSMKDVPYDIPEGFEIASIPSREDVRDVLVSKDNVRFLDLPLNARIGTSSIRRASQIKL
jgi:hydroxymethylbilane synthase